jgi:hypothetical protein
MEVDENRMLRSNLDLRENCMVRSFHNLYFSLNIKSDQIKEDEMGGTCSMHGIN